MRTLSVLLLLSTMAFAGCLSGDGDVTTDSAEPIPPTDGVSETSDASDASSSQAQNSDFDWTGLNRSYPYDGMEEFCLTPESCDYWDGQFHEGTVYELDTLVIDAIVLPVPGPNTLAATETAGMATANWAQVEEFAAPWFVDAWELNTYVVGADVPSPEAVEDPEILVISEGFQRSTSIGLNAEQIACSVTQAGDLDTQDPAFTPGSLATKVYPVHEHDGMAIYAAECITGGFRCLAINFAGTVLGGNNPLYDLVAHEVGHCLGLSHVGDALDFNARFVPTPDIMAYADNPSRVSCPSTLNARVMEGIYAHLADQPVPEWMNAGERLAMDPWDYVHAECPLPPGGLF